MRLECAALQLCNVSHYFGAKPGIAVLTDVSFTVSVGDYLCIAGPSGSGKTTLLTIAAGLLRPTSGEVIVGSRRLRTLPPKEVARLRACHLGLVFQSPNLIPVFSAQENVEFALRLACPWLGAGERRRRVEEVLLFVGLGEQRNVRPGQLSGGECQRVALARAMVKQPGLILADEPTSQLDDLNCHQIQSLLEQLRAECSTTVVVATHDRRMLAGANHLLCLKAGHLEAAWSPPATVCAER